MKLVGNATRYQYLIGGSCVGEDRNFTLQQMLFQKVPIVVTGNSLQHHPLKAVVGHNHTGLGRITLYMLYPFCSIKHIQQAVIDYNRNGLERFPGIKVSNHNIRTQTYHFIAHFMFETDYNGYRHNHHGQPDGYAQHGNADSRFRHLFSTLIATIYSLGNKEFPVHITLLLFQDKPLMPFARQKVHEPNLLSSAHMRYALHCALLPE